MTLRLPVDHLVAVVSELAAARDAFLAAGFTVTPIAPHSAEMGTANACIMLDGLYIELMGIVAPTPANAGWRDLLHDGAGLRGIALRSDDIDASAEALAAAGIEAKAPRHFSRAMPQGELRFSVIRLPRALTPGLQCLYCRHLTPQLLWTADATRHENGATTVAGAEIAGIGALAALATPDDPAALPITEGAGNRIFIDIPRPIQADRLEAIRASSGLVLQRPAPL